MKKHIKKFIYTLPRVFFPRTVQQIMANAKISKKHIKFSFQKFIYTLPQALFCQRNVQQIMKYSKISKNMKIMKRNTKVIRSEKKDALERHHDAPQGKSAYGSGLCFLFGLLWGAGGQRGAFSNRLTTLPAPMALMNPPNNNLTIWKNRLYIR